jgi:hypothetical protein
LFKDVRVLSRNSDPLENIQDYDKLHSLLSDILLSPENRLVRQQEGYGNNSTPIVAAPVSVGDAFNMGTINAQITKLYAGLINHGNASLKCVNEVEVAPGQTVTLCLCLELSATVGGQQQKLLPLWMMTGVSIEFRLNKDAIFNVPTADITYAQLADTSPTFRVDNIQFHGALVEFDNSVNQALLSMASGSNGSPALGIHLSGCTYTNNMVQLAASQNTLTSNLQLRSIKSIFVSFIQNGMKYHRRKTARNNNGISDIQYKFGSMYLPSYPIAGDTTLQSRNGEYIVELLKSVSEYGSSAHTGLINCESFAFSEQHPLTAAALRAAGGDYVDPYNPNKCSRAAYAIECDTFGKEHCESGLNSTINTPINVQWHNIANMASLPQDAYMFIMHDVVWNIMPNGIVTTSVM